MWGQHPILLRISPIRGMVSISPNLLFVTAIDGQNVEWIRAYVEAHGIGNSEEENALNEFIHLFMEQ